MRDSLSLVVSNPALASRRPSAFQRRARLATRPVGGDGASRPGVSVVPRLVVPANPGAAAWRSRLDAARAEARAALAVPFSLPVTWEP